MLLHVCAGLGFTFIVTRVYVRFSDFVGGHQYQGDGYDVDNLKVYWVRHPFRDLYGYF